MAYREIFFSGGPLEDLVYYYSLIEGLDLIGIFYIDGDTEYVTHEEVHKGSGHVEAIGAIFDDKNIDVLDLVRLFMILFDPFKSDERTKEFPNYQRLGIYSFEEEFLEEINDFLSKLEEMHAEEMIYYARYIKYCCKAEEEYQQILIKNLDVSNSIGVDILSRAHNLISYIN